MAMRRKGMNNFRVLLTTRARSEISQRRALVLTLRSKWSHEWQKFHPFAPNSRQTDQSLSFITLVKKKQKKTKQKKTSTTTEHSSYFVDRKVVATKMRKVGIRGSCSAQPQPCQVSSDGASLSKTNSCVIHCFFPSPTQQVTILAVIMNSLLILILFNREGVLGTHAGLVLLRLRLIMASLPCLALCLLHPLLSIIPAHFCWSSSSLWLSSSLSPSPLFTPQGRDSCLNLKMMRPWPLSVIFAQILIKS